QSLPVAPPHAAQARRRRRPGPVRRRRRQCNLADRRVHIEQQRLDAASPSERQAERSWAARAKFLMTVPREHDKVRPLMSAPHASPVQAACRFCGAKLQHTIVDLGMSPLCESYVSPDNANRMEPFYPLRVFLCDNCFLAQLEQYVSAEEIFTEYAYFS